MLAPQKMATCQRSTFTGIQKDDNHPMCSSNSTQQWNNKCALAPNADTYSSTAKVHWSRYDLELWPLTFKTLSAVPTHIRQIFLPSFVEIPPLRQDISRHAECVNGRTTHGRPDGWPNNIIISPTIAGSKA